VLFFCTACALLNFSCNELVVSVDHGIPVTKGKKVKVSINRKRKNKDNNLVERQRLEDVEVDLEAQNGELMIVYKCVMFLYGSHFVEFSLK